MYQFDLLEKEAKVIKKLYLDEHLTVGEVAVKYNVSRFTMHKVMNRIGLERRKEKHSLVYSEGVLPELLAEVLKAQNLTVQSLAGQLDTPYSSFLSYLKGTSPMKLKLAVSMIISLGYGEIEVLSFCRTWRMTKISFSI